MNATGGKHFAENNLPFTTQQYQNDNIASFMFHGKTRFEVVPFEERNRSQDPEVQRTVTFTSNIDTLPQLFPLSVEVIYLKQNF